MWDLLANVAKAAWSGVRHTLPGLNPFVMIPQNLSAVRVYLLGSPNRKIGSSVEALLQGLQLKGLAV